MRLSIPTIRQVTALAEARLLSKEMGILKTARTVGVSVSAVQRIKAEMTEPPGA
jgi:AraC-like DNA-binding protein